jgi:hypothetical protein
MHARVCYIMYYFGDQAATIREDGSVQYPAAEDRWDREADPGDLRRNDIFFPTY